jgi:hypothetical protein
VKREAPYVVVGRGVAAKDHTLDALFRTQL